MRCITARNLKRKVILTCHGNVKQTKTPGVPVKEVCNACIVKNTWQLLNEPSLFTKRPLPIDLQSQTPSTKRAGKPAKSCLALSAMLHISQEAQRKFQWLEVWHLLWALVLLSRSFPAPPPTSHSPRRWPCEWSESMAALGNFGPLRTTRYLTTAPGATSTPRLRPTQGRR